MITYLCCIFTLYFDKSASSCKRFAVIVLCLGFIGWLQKDLIGFTITELITVITLSSLFKQMSNQTQAVNAVSELSTNDVKLNVNICYFA